MPRARELAELATSYDSGGSLGFRNRIINGDMRIAQRGTSFTGIGGAGGYTVDRWFVDNNTDSAVTISQQSDVPTGAGFQNSLRSAVTTADTSIAASQNNRISQKIEGFNVSDLVGRAFTISFWVRSSKTGTHCVALRNSGGDRSYVAEYTVGAANTWEFKTITVADGFVSAGTWNFTNGAGVIVEWVLAVGSTLQTTPGAWQTGTFIGTSNQVNCLDTIGNIFAITGVQLEAGSVATPFERRDYGRELIMCQRYYFSAGVYQWLSRPTDADANLKGTTRYGQTMRATPTITNTASATVGTDAITADYVTWTRGASGVAQVYTFTASAEL
jgi:hypothetical protein